MFLLIIWNSLYKHMEKKFRISGIWLPHNLLRIRKLFYSIMEENSIKEIIMYFLKFSLQTYGKKFRIFGIWPTHLDVDQSEHRFAANQSTDFPVSSQSEHKLSGQQPISAPILNPVFFGGEGGETSVAVNS